MRAKGRIWPIGIMLLIMALLFTACGAQSMTDDGGGGPAGQLTEESSPVQQDPSEPASEEAENTQPEPVQQEEAAPENVPQEQAGTPVQTEQPVPAEGGGMISTARLSYASYAYVDSGDESLPKMIRNVEIPVKTPDASQEALLLGVVEALRTIPQGVEGVDTMVSDLYRINSITVSGGTAVVDIAGEGTVYASEYDEEFFVYQVADSILHSVSGIRSVRFTVDGTPDRGLMYIDIHRDFDLNACDDFCGRQ